MQYKASGKLQRKGKGQKTNERDNSLVPDLQLYMVFRCNVQYV